jgi:hypothetical protein
MGVNWGPRTGDAKNAPAPARFDVRTRAVFLAGPMKLRAQRAIFFLDSGLA